MGNYDGAELCELTGLYILYVLRSEFGKEKITLYCVNGSSCFQNMTGPGPHAERVKKEICEIFQSCALKITIETNLQIMDFHGVTFNLKNQKYYPFRKPNNDPLYTSMLSQIIQKTSSKKFLI